MTKAQLHINISVGRITQLYRLKQSPWRCRWPAPHHIMLKLAALLGGLIKSRQNYYCLYCYESHLQMFIFRWHCSQVCGQSLFQNTFVNVDPITTHLHIALTCVSPYPDNLSGYRSHFNGRCKWVLSHRIELSYLLNTFWLVVLWNQGFRTHRFCRVFKWIYLWSFLMWSEGNRAAGRTHGVSSALSTVGGVTVKTSVCWCPAAHLLAASSQLF